MSPRPLKPPFTLPDVVTGFHQYFAFTAETGAVLAELGYTFERDALTLPRRPEDVGAWADHLRSRSNLVLRRIGMNAEITRREFLIAPLLLEVSLAVDAELHSEYAVNVSPRLHGSLDYLLQKDNALVVVEAKQADMARGFTQLAAELVALDAFAPDEMPLLHGAVSVGDTWRFGVLDRARKHITQDIGQFNVPADLDDLLAVLVGTLKNAPVVGTTTPQFVQ